MEFIKTIKIAVFALLLTFGVSASAAEFTARISSLLLYEGGNLVYIFVEGGTKNPPTCAGSNGDYISFSMARPRAKEYLAGLMFAFGAGKPVLFRTEGACIDQPVSDTLTYFMVTSG